MKIIACIKQVPDTNEVKIDQDKGTLIREGVPSIINPEDKNGLEAAVKLKEKFGGEVIVISMGPPQAKVALKEALAMGADEAILLSDRAFAGSDTWATAYTISQAIKEIKVWTTDDFEVEMDKLGLNASPTQVYETFVPKHEKKGEILEGSYKDIVDNLIKKLKNENVSLELVSEGRKLADELK